MLRKQLFILVILIVLAISAVILFKPPLDTTLARDAEVVIDNTAVRVDVADTPFARERGLSGTAALPDLRGMLFVFDAPGRHGFWMKDMRYSIDIMWLDENGIIVDIKEGAAPESYPEVFYPQGAALYVLEVNAGFVSQREIKAGDDIQLPIEKTPR